MKERETKFSCIVILLFFCLLRPVILCEEKNDVKNFVTLIERLRHESAQNRERAAYALGRSKSEKAVEPLILALKDKNCDVRWAVAWALGEIKSKKAVEPLKKALTDKDPDVRKAARAALKKIMLNI